MQIVIDIPEERYEKYKRIGDSRDILFEAIRKGTVLPKHHGRLIDADHFKDVVLLHSWHGNDKNIVPYGDRRGYRLRDNEVLTALVNAPTIIGAERGGEE